MGDNTELESEAAAALESMGTTIRDNQRKELMIKHATSDSSLDSTDDDDGDSEVVVGSAVPNRTSMDSTASRGDSATDSPSMNFKRKKFANASKHWFNDSTATLRRKKGRGAKTLRRKSSSATSSGEQRPASNYKGVQWLESLRVWSAKIEIDGKVENLGLFSREMDCAMAYDRKALELFGSDAQLNFPGRTSPPFPSSKTKSAGMLPHGRAANRGDGREDAADRGSPVDTEPRSKRAKSDVLSSRSGNGDFVLSALDLATSANPRPGVMPSMPPGKILAEEDDMVAYISLMQQKRQQELQFLQLKQLQELQSLIKTQQRAVATESGMLRRLPSDRHFADLSKLRNNPVPHLQQHRPISLSLSSGIDSMFAQPQQQQQLPIGLGMLHGGPSSPTTLFQNPLTSPIPNPNLVAPSNPWAATLLNPLQQQLRQNHQRVPLPVIPRLSQSSTKSLPNVLSKFNSGFGSSMKHPHM